MAKKITAAVILLLFIFPIFYGAAETGEDSKAAMRADILVLIEQKKEEISKLYLEDEQIRLKHKEIFQNSAPIEIDYAAEEAKKDELGRKYAEAIALYGVDAVNQEDYYYRRELSPIELQCQAEISAINEVILEREEELFALQKQHDALLPIYS